MGFFPCNSEAHELNRNKVCAICLLKSKLIVTENQASLIRQKSLENYDPADSSQPRGLCCKCQIELSKQESVAPSEYERGYCSGKSLSLSLSSLLLLLLLLLLLFLQHLPRQEPRAGAWGGRGVGGGGRGVRP
jgi:hypothetical protein